MGASECYGGRGVSNFLSKGILALALVLSPISLAGVEPGLRITDFHLGPSELSFNVAGTFPFRPNHAAESFYFTNPLIDTDPGFVRNGVRWATTFSFTGRQRLRPGEPIGTGVTSYGDYFWVVFEEPFERGEEINGRITARWSTPVFVLSEMSSVNVWWGSGGRPTIRDGARLEDGVFLGSVGGSVDLIVTATQNLDVIGSPGAVTQEVRVLNRGPSDATGLILDISQSVPAGGTISTSLVSEGTFDAGTWTIPELRRSSQEVLRFRVDVPSSLNGEPDAVTTSATVRSVDQPLAIESIESASVSATIISPADVGILEQAPSPSLNLQDGLFTHRVTLTNDNPSELAGFRLLIEGLPGDVQVYNAQGTTPGGSFYIDSNNNLGAGESVTLTIEFFRPDLDPRFTPSYAIEAVYTNDPAEPAPAATGADLDRVLVLPSEDFLLEFTSSPGENYAIEYTHNMRSWHRVAPSITANSNRTQWIDAGPPKTISHPSSVAVRCYRVVTLPPRP